MTIKDFFKKSKSLVFIVRKLKSIFFSLKKKYFAKIINDKLISNTIVHLVFNDKFIKPYVSFINKYFNHEDHVFLCKRWFDKYPFPEDENVFEIETFDYINLRKVKKIICHSAFDNDVINYFYENKELLKKTCCIIWGGEFTCRTKEEMKSKDLYVLSNFYQYIGGIDEPIVRKMYNISEKQKFFNKPNYSFPVSKEILDNVKINKKNYIQIQLGQSVQESILDSLDYLYKFKDENIRVVTILSYGGNGFLEKEIIKKGTSLFGNKFMHIDSYMSPNDYADHISNNDILILNTDHQDAFGNTIAHLYLGKKVFIRSDIPTGTFLLENYDIHVYPTESIKNLSFNDFIDNSYSQINKKGVEQIIDEKLNAKNWQEVFDS